MTSNLPTFQTDAAAPSGGNANPALGAMLGLLPGAGGDDATPAESGSPEFSVLLPELPVRLGVATPALSRTGDAATAVVGPNAAATDAAKGVVSLVRTSSTKAPEMKLPGVESGTIGAELTAEELEHVYEMVASLFNMLPAAATHVPAVETTAGTTGETTGEETAGYAITVDLGGGKSATVRMPIARADSGSAPAAPNGQEFARAVQAALTPESEKSASAPVQPGSAAARETSVPNPGTGTFPASRTAAASTGLPVQKSREQTSATTGRQAGAALPAATGVAHSLQTGGSAVQAPASGDAGTSDEGASISAEFALPDGRSVRVTIAPRAEAAAASGHPAFSANGAPEKTAAFGRGVLRAERSDVSGLEKNFLTVEDQQGTEQRKVAGIGGAELSRTMSAATAEVPVSLREPENRLFGVANPIDRVAIPQSAAAESSSPTLEHAETTQASLAHRAVETVVDLAEVQFAARMTSSSSVNIKMKFAGEDLAVRVEMRDGEVQTQFKTDSEELRGALAREWQVVASQSPSQSMRFLEPVFTANNAGRENASSFTFNDQARQHAQSEAGRQATNTQFTAVRPVRKASAGPVEGTDAAVRRPAMPPTAVHLSVFA